jgi:hypothetical protein
MTQRSRASRAARDPEPHLSDRPTHVGGIGASLVKWRAVAPAPHADTSRKLRCGEEVISACPGEPIRVVVTVRQVE